MKLKCEFCKVWLPLMLILAAGFYTAWLFVPKAAPNTLRIAAGSKTGAYYHYAQQYQSALQAEGIELHLQETAGSVESLQLLQDGSVDLAFIQGGIGEAVAPEHGLRSVASLFYEPLWVFTASTNGEASINYLSQLKGKQLAIGNKGSGTHALTKRLLAENGIHQDNTTLLSLSSDKAAEQLSQGKLDAAFFVSAPHSKAIMQLSTQHHSHLMSFQHHANAYTRNYPFLSTLTLGEGSLNLPKNIPEQDTTLLTATAALVVSPAVHSDHVRLLTREALKIHSKPDLLEKAWQFPSKNHLEIPIHPDAEHYLSNGPSFLEKYLPFSLAAKIDQFKILLIPLLTLLLPLIKGILPLYAWRIRSRTFRWYKKLNKVDRDLKTYNLTETQSAISEMQRLHAELAQEVSVPLSYMSEFYNLRMHTDHIIQRLQARENLLSDNPAQVKNIPIKDTDSPISEPAEPTIKKKRFKRRSKNKEASKPPLKEAEAVLEKDSPTTLLKPSNASVAAQQPAHRPNTAPAINTTVSNHKHQQAKQLLNKHIAASMALSSIPVPLLDVAALTTTQLNLLDKLSQLYGVSFDRKRDKSTLVALISSALPVTTVMGLASMSKFLPGIGSLGGAASTSLISGAVTYATGTVFIQHYENGGNLSNFNSKQQRAIFRSRLKEGLANSPKA